ncbi:MAG TPA: polysaccharide deacetylase family protein [Candidatus Acidoferrum sp.]|nr:polysaccharide deacetylase family protein [Candidatus Acidoferrum sp.]
MSERLSFGPPCISVDVEDWPQSTWDQTLPISQRSADNTRHVLDLLGRVGIRATMFVLGKFAEKYPDVVREIQSSGHEVACHGYAHTAIFKQSEKTFREDIRHGKDLLEQAIGHRVSGYRAPDFSIVRETLWALAVLAEEGFAYDSSVFPVWHTRYGIPQWPTEPVLLLFRGNISIYELPIATFRGLGTNWPVGGGGYHRLLPGGIIRYFAKRALTVSPFVLYCHPYEFDPHEFKEIPLKLPLSVRLHQGLGRRWFEYRFHRFLREFGGRKMIDLLQSNPWRTMNIAEVIQGYSE